MIRIISESYDPFKKDMKKSSNGQYTDGRGNSYDIGKSTSDVIKFNGMNFQYDYNDCVLKWLSSDGSEEIDYIGLSVGNWLDNPDYWIERYAEEIEEETAYLADEV